MATYGIKVNAAIATSQSRNTTGTTTIYTAPANGYAIVNIYVVTSSTNASHYSQLEIATQPIFNIENAGTKAFPSANTGSFVGGLQSIYIGPSQALRINYTAGTGTVVTYVTGVEFSS